MRFLRPHRFDEHKKKAEEEKRKQSKPRFTPKLLTINLTPTGVKGLKLNTGVLIDLNPCLNLAICDVFHNDALLHKFC